MPKLLLVAATATLLAGSLPAQFLEDLKDPNPKQKFGELTFSGGNLTASRKTGELSATGNIVAESGDYRFFTDKIDLTSRFPQTQDRIGQLKIFKVFADQGKNLFTHL